MTEARWSTEPRNHVWHMVSTEAHEPGSATFVSVSDDQVSFNDILRKVSELTAQYQVDRPCMVTGFGPRDEHGRQTRFRWSWERLTTWNGRLSDTLLVHVVDWS